MRSTTLSSRLDESALYVVTLVLVIGTFHFNNILADDPIRRLSTFSDDFYYYAEIARNLVNKGALTFDTVTQTNGFQPLWFLTVVAIGTSVGFSTDGLLMVFPFVTYTLVLVAFYGMARFLSDLVLERRIVKIAAFAYAIVAFEISVGFMEIAAVLAVFPFILDRLYKHQMLTVTFGGLCTIAFLARLDSVIIVSAIIGLTILTDPAFRRHILAKRRDLWRPTVGLSPSLAYLAGNIAFFGHPIPDSGLAKSLADGLSVHAATWWDFIAPVPPSKLVWTAAFGYAVLMVILSCMVRIRPYRMVRILQSMVVAVFVFYFLNSVRSSWGLWGWYFYPIVGLVPLAVAATLTNLQRLNIAPSRLTSGAICAVFILLTTGKVYQIFQDRYTPIAEAAVDLAAFAAVHPGRYAMGDRAGTPAYLMSEPVVQLEGLVSGKTMLRLIDREAPICRTFREFDVDYYVGMRGAMERTAPGCFRIEEPVQGGHGTPRMRGVLCGEPVQFRHDGFTTMVFDLSKARCDGSTPCPGD